VDLRVWRLLFDWKICGKTVVVMKEWRRVEMSDLLGCGSRVRRSNLEARGIWRRSLDMNSNLHCIGSLGMLYGAWSCKM
jgi:hypothetical protein